MAAPGAHQVPDHEDRQIAGPCIGAVVKQFLPQTVAGVPFTLHKIAFQHRPAPQLGIAPPCRAQGFLPCCDRGRLRVAIL